MSELRNIIDMRRYYAKTVFGFAVAKTNLPVSRLLYPQLQKDYMSLLFAERETP